MNELNEHLVAAWLMNEDGTGATDEQFYNTIKLMKSKISNQLSDDYTFWDWMIDVYNEIEYNINNK